MGAAAAAAAAAPPIQLVLSGLVGEVGGAEGVGLRSSLEGDSRPIIYMSG